MVPSVRLELLSVMPVALSCSPGDGVHAIGVAMTNSVTLAHCNALQSVRSIRIAAMIAENHLSCSVGISQRRACPGRRGIAGEFQQPGDFTNQKKPRDAGF